MVFVWYFASSIRPLARVFGGGSICRAAQCDQILKVFSGYVSFRLLCPILNRRGRHLGCAYLVFQEGAATAYQKVESAAQSMRSASAGIVVAQIYVF